MTSIDPETLRAKLAQLGPREQKTVLGLFTVMIQNPARVRESEWMSEQVTHLSLMAGEFDADTPQAGVEAVQSYLAVHAEPMLETATLLFQRVGLDLQPKVQAGESFTSEDAVNLALSYLAPAAQEKSDEGRLVKTSERDLGEQPLAQLMTKHELKAADLVAASKEQITHKMVARAMKGRRLTAKTMNKIHRAWNLATKTECPRSELFNYKP